MFRSKSLCVTLFVLTVMYVRPAPFARAQDGPGNIGQVFFVEPKAGTVLQFEEAYRKHVDWHRSKNDRWSWQAWEITSGERTGQFAIATFGHQWKDMERGELGVEDRTHALENQDPYVASTTIEIWRRRPELSNPPTGGDTPRYSIVYYRHLNQGMTGVYSGAVRKINDAITKAGWGVGYYRHVLVNSGEEPTMVRWVARPTWEDFAPPTPSFPKLLQETYGREDAASVTDALNRSIHCGRSEIWTYRPDLSYTPASP